MFHISDSTVVVRLHRELLDTAVVELERRPILGIDHTTTVQNHVSFDITLCKHSRYNAIQWM